MYARIEFQEEVASLFKVKESTQPEVELFKGVKIYLPTPEALNFNVNQQQILSATYLVDAKEKSYTSEVYVQTNPKQIILVAASGWGGSIFSINYNGKTIESSSLPMPNAQMGITHTLTDFILTYASDDILNKTFENTPVKIIYKPQKRIFLLNNKEAMEITYSDQNRWKGDVILNNYIYHYQIKIKNINNINK